MSVPISDLLKGCKDKEGMKLLLNQAQEAYLSWESLWTQFITAPLLQVKLTKYSIENDDYRISLLFDLFTSIYV